MVALHRATKKINRRVTSWTPVGPQRRANPGQVVHTHWERKCADSTGAVPVPWVGHFQC